MLEYRVANKYRVRPLIIMESITNIQYSVLPRIFSVVVEFYMNLVLFIQYIVNSVSVVLSERW